MCTTFLKPFYLQSYAIFRKESLGLQKALAFFYKPLLRKKVTKNNSAKQKKVPIETNGKKYSKSPEKKICRVVSAKNYSTLSSKLPYLCASSSPLLANPLPQSGHRCGLSWSGAWMRRMCSFIRILEDIILPHTSHG